MRIRIKQRKNKGRGKAQWAGPYRWVALGTLAAYGSMGDAWLAHAQNAQQNEAALPARRFEISAGPLETVFDAFATASGFQVQFMQDGIRTVPSPGVSGLYTPEQALRKLLAGTGVTFRFASEDKVAVDLAAVAGSVEVTARVEALQTSSPKYAGPLLDTPQTITEVSRQVMEEQGTTTLRDALRNVAGISLAAGEGGAQGDNLTIRGFTARNDLFIDGMRDFGSYYRDPFNLQEVEVLQGPSSVTFGRGSTGGVVNQASKTPGHGHGSISASMRFRHRSDAPRDARHQPAAAQARQGRRFRLNVMGDMRQRRRPRCRRESPLRHRAVARVRTRHAHPLDLQLLPSDRRRHPDYGIPWLFNGPAPVPRNNYYGFTDGNYLRTYDDIGTAKVEHDFNQQLHDAQSGPLCELRARRADHRSADRRRR